MPRLLPLLLLLLALPAAAQDAPAPPPADTAPADGPLMLWTLADADNTVYLLGSIHLVRDGFFPLAAPIEAAYDDAETVVFEIDLADMQAQAMKFAQRGMFADTTSLADVLPDSLYAQARTAVQPYGLPPAAIDRMEPWMLGLTLTSLELMANGFAEGVDTHLYQRAQVDEKTLQALETVDFQLSLFDTMPMDTQANFLRYTLDELETMTTAVDSLTAAWHQGDAAAMDALMNEGFADFPELATLLLDQRNAAWVPQIEALLEGSDDALVVVGAGHLVGDASVVTMLEAKGYIVTQQ